MNYSDSKFLLLITGNACMGPAIDIYKHFLFVFRELDRDGDGRISYKDFDFMMKYDTKSHL